MFEFGFGDLGRPIPRFCSPKNPKPMFFIVFSVLFTSFSMLFISFAMLFICFSVLSATALARRRASSRWEGSLPGFIPWWWVGGGAGGGGGGGMILSVSSLAGPGSSRNSLHDFFFNLFFARFLERIFRPKLLQLSPLGSKI